jgi:predicted protein tyrosine phosphatase
LEWAADKTNLVVACRAGISRSSASAVVIMASRGPILDAVNVLRPEIHSPNLLIVRYGEQILGKPGLTEAVQEWKRWRRSTPEPF